MGIALTVIGVALLAFIVGVLVGNTTTSRRYQRGLARRHSRRAL